MSVAYTHSFIRVACTSAVCYALSDNMIVLQLDTDHIACMHLVGLCIPGCRIWLSTHTSPYVPSLTIGALRAR